MMASFRMAAGAALLSLALPVRTVKHILDAQGATA